MADKHTSEIDDNSVQSPVRRAILKLGILTFLGTATAVEINRKPENMTLDVKGLRELQDKLFKSKSKEEAVNSLASISLLVENPQFKFPEGYRFTVSYNLYDKNGKPGNFTESKFIWNEDGGKRRVTYYVNGMSKTEISEKGFSQHISDINFEDINSIVATLVSPDINYVNKVPSILNMTDVQTDKYNFVDMVSFPELEATNKDVFSGMKYNQYTFFEGDRGLYMLDANIKSDTKYSITRIADNLSIDINNNTFNNLLPPTVN
ncbi:hypothetical protein BH10PAT1_BH10PAT1_0930 [soil metagenome]